jgi:hypothetical protein
LCIDKEETYTSKTDDNGSIFDKLALTDSIIDKLSWESQCDFGPIRNVSSNCALDIADFCCRFLPDGRPVKQVMWMRSSLPGTL